VDDPAFQSGFRLFCNIFRISRRLEMLWACVFIILVLGTVTLGVPAWPVTVSSCLAVTVVVVTIEMRKPSYHGVLWQRINPELPNWWAAQ
jgi:hypothetical protein